MTTDEADDELPHGRFPADGQELLLRLLHYWSRNTWLLTVPVEQANAWICSVKDGQVTGGEA